MSNMYVVNQFILDDHYKINILIPHFIDKVNYFYKPTQKLHRFDEVTIVLDALGKNTILAKDTVDLLVECLKIKLEKVLENKIPLLPKNIKCGELGRHFNEHEYKAWSINDLNLSESFDYSLFWLWSMREVQTWIYTYQDLTYIEISSSYPMIYSSSAESDDYDFKQYMYSYKPFLLYEVTALKAQEWLAQCKKILQVIGIE
jgi:hypothetical protein